MLFFGVDTEKDWINSTTEIPVLGHLFTFALIFIPPVIVSFIARSLIPGLHNDIGFTKSMLVLLPSWNLLIWLFKVRLFILFIPAWLLFGVIAIIKVITGDY
ncbi:MAG TPA: hypothetical protein VIV35_02300 [Chitinophagaceae bacterium]